MRVHIQVVGLQGAAQLRRFASQKLDVALSCFADRIEGASVRLLDINGADRGGVDKLCRIVLTLKASHYTHLPPLYPIVLSDEHRERADELGEAGV